MVSAASRTEERLEAAFDAATDLTLGVEEELMLLDADTLRLAPVGPRLLAELDDPGRFRPELPAACVEVVSDVCRSSREVRAQLADGRRRLRAAAGDAVRIAAAGAHPFDLDMEPSPGERNAAVVDDYGPAARFGGLAFGLHVHVGVTGLERAVALADALRSYLPLLAALAANAPCLAGRDSGLWSVRPKLAELLPRQGVPPALGSAAAYADLVTWGRASGVFDDARRLWWEVRPHPGHGTVEVRVCDQPTRVEHAAALAAVVHALAARLLARLDADGRLPVHPTIRIEENRWRALRHGLDGTLLDLDTGEPRPTRALVAALLGDLVADAAGLGGAADLIAARALLARNGTERQRGVLDGRDVHGLTDWLATETARGL